MAYYRGDYYRGDYYRGGIFSAIGKVAGRAGGLIGKAGRFIPGISTGIAVAETARGLLPKKKVTSSTSGARPKPGIEGTIERLLPFGETGYIRRRRMNVANVKALRRAIRRAHGFSKLAKSVMTYPFQKPKKGMPLFKKKRR